MGEAVVSTHGADSPGDERIPWWRVVLPGAAAGGMGWGIRGQYGHETGAMLAGVLVGFALVWLLARRLPPGDAVRAVALLAVGVGFGGSETYGQTIGLTQNAPVVGNATALAWGMLGLFIKGGLWIGIAGAFFGMGLGGVRYRAREGALLLGGMLVAWLLGETLLNTPFDPAHRRLPPLYFSADWRWEPDALSLKPRPERWGGLLLAWIALLAWTGGVRKDRMALALGLAGGLFGGIGFAGGQCFQAAHGWHREAAAAALGRWDSLINWWNLMEITFGAVWGAGIGGVLWRLRARIAAPPDTPPSLHPAVEATLLAVQVAGLYLWTFGSWEAFDRIADRALPMGLIPLVLALGGRRGPALVALPLTLLPIAAKTFHELCVEKVETPLWLGVPLYLLLPLGVALWIALRGPDATLLRRALLWAPWLYFGLNFAIFRMPWPWAEWTARTPSMGVFLLCGAVLTAAALRRRE